MLKRCIFQQFYYKNSFFPLLKLNRRRGLTCAVVEDAVYAFDFIDDAVGDGLEDGPGEGGAFGGHEVGGEDGPEGDGVVVSTAVAHDADRAQIGEGGEVLSQVSGKAGLVDFFPVDGVSVLDDFDFFRRDFTNDPDTETGAGEGLAADEAFGNAKLAADFPDFVFEEEAQGFHDFLEVHMIRQAANVVVGFDDGGFAEAAFDDVGVDGALDEEIDLSDFFRFPFKDADKFFTDDLALSLGIGDTFKLGVEGFVGVYADEVQVVGAVRAKHRRHFVAFVFPQEAVIDENAGELATDGLGEENRRHRGIDAAGEGAEGPPGTDLRLEVGDGAVDEGVHFPIPSAAADGADKVLEHSFSLGGVEHFGVKLDGVEAPGAVFHGRYRADRRRCRYPEAFGHRSNIVGVAHPSDGFFRHAGKKP